MTQSIIVIVLVGIALAFWLNRLFPLQAARLRTQLGIARQTAPQTQKKGCNSCDRCKGGGCH
ncbi:hypothetical protein [Asaia prunellae]|uniref:hypothetical protein n=1 Tax=Asaia prunellae TaxID=610245 RepID=UPI00047102C7|nr:hypothetical protein [Asaia prunellae]